jgi:hypothetical protein
VCPRPQPAPIERPIPDRTAAARGHF